MKAARLAKADTGRQTDRIRRSIAGAALLLSAALWLGGCRPPDGQKGSGSESAGAAPKQPPPAQKADVGVGRATQRMARHGEGFVATPAKALFRAKEKIVFQIQIPHALNLYQAEKGRLPASHEEFMKEIIEANNIALPELPEGRVYRYRPDKGELWVENAEQNLSSPQRKRSQR